MKTCIKCGCEITNGINGCMLMNECFDCHGGYPKYPKSTRENYSNEDAADYWEGQILARQEAY